jgi:hypothetical protein
LRVAHYIPASGRDPSTHVVSAGRVAKRVVETRTAVPASFAAKIVRRHVASPDRLRRAGPAWSGASAGRLRTSFIAGRSGKGKRASTRQMGLLGRSERGFGQTCFSGGAKNSHSSFRARRSVGCAPRA